MMRFYVFLILFFFFFLGGGGEGGVPVRSKDWNLRRYRLFCRHEPV